MKTYDVFVNKRGEISIAEKDGEKITDLLAIPVDKAEEVASALLIAYAEAQCLQG